MGRASQVLLGIGLLGCAATEGPLLVAADLAADAAVTSPGTAEGAVQPGMRLQYQLSGALDESVDADLFVVDLFTTTTDQLERLHLQGRVTAAYISAGSYEPWRPDADDFAPDAIGAPLPDYPNEAWLDVRAPSVRQVQRSRLQLAAEKGFDGVVFTSMDAYARDSGHELTAADQLDYNLWLADQARALGLAAGISGDWTQAERLAQAYDFAIHVNCLAAGRCAELEPYRALGRAVFDLETTGTPQTVCAQAAQLGLPVTLKQGGFDVWLRTCP